MRHGYPRILLCAGAFAVASATDLIAQETQGKQQLQPVVPLKAETLYQGWRGSKLIGRSVLSKAGKTLGSVSNIIIDDHGRIQALIVQGLDDETSLDHAYRIAWRSVEKDGLPARVHADVNDLRQSIHGLFAGNETTDEKDEYRLTEFLGDYARLQPGLAYGHVTDVVFSDNGAIVAVLVTRQPSAGGGTYAFGFPGSTGPWSPRLSYYGLPYVTAEHATAAGLRVDLRRFDTNPAG